jgi:pimeloyl-ACP methyl ester carboxylesterase
MRGIPRDQVCFPQVWQREWRSTTPSHSFSWLNGQLGYTKVDVPGFSIGGHIARELLFHHGDLTRKAILASTMPQGGKGLTNSKPEVIAPVSVNFGRSREELLNWLGTSAA